MILLFGDILKPFPGLMLGVECLVLRAVSWVLSVERSPRVRKRGLFRTAERYRQSRRKWEIINFYSCI